MCSMRALNDTSVQTVVSIMFIINLGIMIKVLKLETQQTSI